ncbi:hypothetical protein PFISCL1PPCAC_3793, partial [Pristionchus fissidentatus]
QCESLRYTLVGGLAVRRACYGVLRFIMWANAQGCEESWVSRLPLLRSYLCLWTRQLSSLPDVIVLRFGYEGRPQHAPSKLQLLQPMI